MDKTTIVKNFSRHAATYDKNCDLQNEAASMLARILPRRGVGRILEIGCGTGNYTAMLKDIFKDAAIRAIDISESMVKEARQKIKTPGVSFESCDAESADLGKGYDLVTSSAVFHWLSDLDGMIRRSRSCLNGNGSLVFSVFGTQTFSELKASLKSVLGENISISPDLFLTRVKLETTLSKYFKAVNVTERLLRGSYASIYDLLKNIKYSGTNGSGAGLSRVWSPALLKKIESYYVGRFGSVEATYQVFFCEARK